MHFGANALWCKCTVQWNQMGRKKKDPEEVSRMRRELANRRWAESRRDIRKAVAAKPVLETGIFQRAREDRKAHGTVPMTDVFPKEPSPSVLTPQDRKILVEAVLPKRRSDDKPETMSEKVRRMREQR